MNVPIFMELRYCNQSGFLTDSNLTEIYFYIENNLHTFFVNISFSKLNENLFNIEKIPLDI